MGIVIPREAVLKERLKEGENVEIIIVKRSNPITETFGRLKGKLDAKALLKELDKEGWDD